MKFTEMALNSLKEALKKFGTHNFDDKGPGDVMNVSLLTRELGKLSTEDAAAALRELAQSSECEGRGLRLAECLVGNLEDWEDLFKQDGIVEIYNGEMPTQAVSTPSGVHVAKRRL